MKLLHYNLSQEADFDIEKIFDYTEKEYGFNQAVSYLTDLEAVFNNLVIHPEIGRQRNEIKQDLFSITEQQHIIFYRLLNNHIRIVRVLHGSKDIPRNFK
ncbi:type II toxin-antitoxin system RelE/ParE family toxin [Polaribacter sp. Z014]|uniref:type II toxin-antitoxin system RelE/ParE family toxin n=1 Tax=Polaribacter sp. Z014 TaxID=2927126 RepID=UPI00202295F0|nr:type II toxin-antitoxin system RelE/ParE family toxin [Polaribacter sp. Z014]MCL7761798.1 type II toxin-antitoxin system RelE/ParE family toxin [Polaribacter sp. Z014]